MKKLIRKTLFDLIEGNQDSATESLNEYFKQKSGVILESKLVQEENSEATV